MSFLSMILEILEIKMESPTPYGWFHLLMCGITIAWILDLCLLHKNDSETKIRKTVFITGIVVFILEIYKQIVYTFSVENGVIHTNFQWYAFPWQFCSIPMYVGMLTGLFRKGKIHQSLCAFLATYGIFAGCAVMLYPVSIYIDLIGINIQTSVCHGSMIVIGAYLLATGYVKLEGKTLLPSCMAQFTRRAADVRFADGTVCELCGDIGMLMGGTAQEDFCELEVELKEGSEETAAAFAEELAERFDLQEEVRSKFARAAALAEKGSR